MEFYFSFVLPPHPPRNDLKKEILEPLPGKVEGVYVSLFLSLMQTPGHDVGSKCKEMGRQREVAWPTDPGLKKEH